MASKISTYGCPVRTNNITESFHNIAVEKLGTRNINIWTFLEKLSNLIADQELDFRRLTNGIRSRRSRTRINRERDTKIFNAQTDLVNKRLPLKEFLLMFTNIHISEMERITSLEDAESSSDIIIQATDAQLFTENLSETFQTRTQIRRRSRYVHTNTSSLRTDVFEKSADQGTENSSDTQRTITQTIEQTSHMTQNEETQAVSVTSDSENEFTNTQDQGTENSSDTQRIIIQAIEQTSHMTQNEEFQVVYVTSDSEDEFTNIQDDGSIYDVPEDDYGHLYSSTNANQRNDSTDLPFHNVDWTLQNSQSTSKEKSSSDICTVCYTDERTHIFIPCGHLACCFQCIERLEANRCPICNVTYENYIRVITS